MKYLLSFTIATVLHTPRLAQAQNPSAPPSTLAELVIVFIDLINLAIPLIITLAFLVIAWKLVDAWVISAGDETKRAEGKMTAIIGVVVVVIMLSIWGIVRLLQVSLFG